MHSKRVDLILRLGLAFAFIYPALDALADPVSWIGYFPPFMHGFVPDMVLLDVFGAIEIILALWLLSGWRVFWPALGAFAMLLGIVVFDHSDFQILFRDISIASIALALMVAHSSGSSERGRGMSEDGV